ncbi:MAG: glycosyltransferase family 2 protein [Acidimicrobiia bacterium]|nr:glycosyltransferase family 2 protein [Acidimicrobiia bacterium]
MTTGIDVVILTRQRRTDLEAALRSALPQLGPADTITVLENGCPERSTAGLDTDFPTVRFLTEHANLGVTGGRNKLIDATTGDLVMFLDDDGELGDGSLDAIRTALDEHPHCGVIACRINDPATGLPRSHEFPARVVDRIEEARPVTYFIGAGFAVRRSALSDVGTFDEALFYAGEELDLSYRLVDAGWEIRYEPAASVVHHASPAGRPPGQYFFYHVRNRFRLAVRHLPIRYALSQMVLWSGFFFVKAIRSRRLGAASRGYAAGIRAVPTAIRERKAISGAAVAYLKEHDGRLWY